MPDPILGSSLRRSFPLAALERQVHLFHEVAEQDWPKAAWFRLAAAVHRAHELVAQFLGGGFGHRAASQRVIAAMPGIVVIQDHPFLCLSTPPQLEASFLKSPAFHEILPKRRRRFGVVRVYHCAHPAFQPALASALDCSIARIHSVNAPRRTGRYGRRGRGERAAYRSLRLVSDAACASRTP